MKFRAWDKQQGKMLYDGFAIVPTSPTWSAFILRYDEKVDALINDYWKEKGDILGGDYSTVDNSDWYGIKYLEVMRYTGLEDKNGKPIYEGDIVRVLYNWPSKGDDDPRSLDQYLDDIAKIGKVVFEGFAWRVAFPDDGHGPITFGPHGFIEIIGNIYENSDLLNETTN